MVSRSVIIVLLTLGSLTICSFSAYGLPQAYNNNHEVRHTLLTTTTTVTDPQILVKDKPTPIIANSLLPKLFNKVKDSVIKIRVTVEIPNPHLTVNGTPVGVPYAGRGSGFIYDEEGHIVTNYHVIQGAKTVSVRFSDGNNYRAKITGQDIYSDLAVLQPDTSALYREQLKPLPVANSSSIQVGQPIVAIGSPEGLTNSMSQGIISQINRLDIDFTRRFLRGDLIQTDAAINPGSSGGPLLNLQGQVIGVSEFGLLDPITLAPEPGLNFAIPSYTMQRVVPQLITQGNYKHPWLGIIVGDITPDIAEKVGLKEAKGVGIVNVTSGSPADLVGISIGLNSSYIIVGVDKKLVKESVDLVNYINNKSPGDEVVLKVLEKDLLVHPISVRLGERPEP
jgi:S1-C subfamily serine protease